MISKIAPSRGYFVDFFYKESTMNKNLLNMNVLIIAPSTSSQEGQPNASTLRTELLGKGLKPENVIVQSDKALTEEITAAVNKRGIAKILTFNVPLGTLETLVKKLAGGPKQPKVYSLDAANQNQRLSVKKGFLYLINCPSQLF